MPCTLITDYSSFYEYRQLAEPVFVAYFEGLIKKRGYNSLYFYKFYKTLSFVGD